MNVDLLGGPFGSVFDVGGNIGEWAESARRLWPDARLTSFEPLPGAVNAHRERAAGRWLVEQVAISDRGGTSSIQFCENQHTASSMQDKGAARFEHFGIRDRHTWVPVKTAPLDSYLSHMWGRLLVKIDVEGHEREVLAGATGVLEVASTVVIEVQNDPTVYLGAPDAAEVDWMLRARGLRFAGVCGAGLAPDGTVLQFDGVWRRASEIDATLTPE